LLITNSEYLPIDKKSATVYIEIDIFYVYMKYIKAGREPART